jgi:ATP-dependent helicase/nuclease subunit A
MNPVVTEAKKTQRQAADPGRSTVLEAAAGSGKTTVLVDRFLRTCLAGDGTDPRAVLAITFTRKATIEIQERLQKKAEHLAGLDRDQLADELHTMFDRDPTPAELARAAWFHEALLDDPAGLGIDTMHAFCQKVLGRFAAEAGLDPRFAVLDERQEADGRAEALDQLESRLARDPDAAADYVGLAGTAKGARMKVADLFAHRVHLQRWVDRVAPPPASLAAALGRPLRPLHDALMADLGAAVRRDTPWADDPAMDPALLAAPLAASLREFVGPGLDAVVAAEGAKPTAGFTKQVDEFRVEFPAAADRLDADADAIDAVADTVGGLLLTKSGGLRSLNGKKDTKELRLDAFARAAVPILRLLGLRDLRALLDRNRALLRHGLHALDLYAAVKRRDRVVDFQDLEYLALRLLTTDGIGQHVHYRLDARLDHLLLDEFQDTNRNQWELLEPLLDEILAGGERSRSAFVVGDVKQSIYGFRGAEPGVFATAHEKIVAQCGEDAALTLPTNFRSLRAIVDTVGALFTQPPLRDHMGADVAAGAMQQAARDKSPGQVTFVPVFPSDDDASGHDHAAAAVADFILDLRAGDPLTWRWNPDLGEDEEVPLELGDIMVLSRTKTHLASYELALRRAGIPFVPAGRGLLARSREVQDVLALLRWLAYPADDTAGATVLRSPCFRLAEDQLRELLRRRFGSRRRRLTEVLQQDADALGLAAVRDLLNGWFDHAGLLPLHDLLRRVMREGDLPARFETAGGEQARYNLLRLFDLALAAEARGGSLRDFIAELEKAERLGGEDEGALPGEDGAGRVQVMTVHGAKGREAPVVILVDAASPPREQTAELAVGGDQADGPWVMTARAEHYDERTLHGDVVLPAPLGDARRRELARMRAEEAHILYVAMTRARDRLVVLGGMGKNVQAGGYLDLLAEASNHLDADVRDRWWQTAEDFAAEVAGPTPGADGDTAPDDTAPDGPVTRARHAADRLARWTPPALAPRLVMDAPSTLDDDRGASSARPTGADDPADTSPPATHRDTDATRRGTAVHAWLERAALLGRFPDQPVDPRQHEHWQEARSVWDDPALDWILRPAAPDSRGLSEVPMLHIPDPAQPTRRVGGFIDRLVLSPGRVDIVDYKSNRITPDQAAAMTDHYRPQLMAYRAALADIHPDCGIRCWLVWTAPAMAGRRLTEVTP